MDISKEPRLLASEVLSRVEKYDAYANISFDAVVIRGNIPVKVKSLGKELLFGVLRNKSYLESIISRFLKHPLKQMHPFVRRQLLIASYQIIFLDNIPHPVVVDKAVELVKLNLGNSPSRFVNAVLRNILREDNYEIKTGGTLLSSISSKYSFLPWISQILINSIGEDEAEELAKSLNVRSRTILRVNTLKNSRDELIEILNKKLPEVETNKTVFSPFGINTKKFSDPVRQNLHRNGNYLIQDESSQLVGLYVDPKPGEKILDACAGTGGKSLHMAALMENKGEILSVDLRPSKMDALKQRAKRVGTDIVFTATMDLLENTIDDSFDKVLLDAPCSGLGVLRRHPEAKWRITQKDIDDVIGIQRKMLDKMAPLVKSGGVLTYIVCTFNSDETTAQVDWFLSNHPEFEEIFPEKRDDLDWSGLINERGNLSLWPHRHDSDGFFGARFKRKG